MRKLDGKIAVVTGATEGMALETARRFTEEGAYVFITGRAQPKEVQQLAADRSPNGRVGQPEEIASVALFLPSSDSSYVNGLDVAVDSGFSIPTL